MAFVALGVLLVVACTPNEVAEWWEAPEELRLVSPSQGERVVAEQLPILARVPRRLRDSEPVLLLDGEPVEAVVVIRRRWWKGKEADLLGELSMAGVGPGEHTLSLELHNEGEIWAVQQRFSRDLQRQRVELSVVDAQGHPRNARVEVFDEDGVPFHTGNADDALADPSQRDVVRSSLFVVGGVGHLRLPPGRYSLLASGGVRDGVSEVEVRVPDDRSVQLTVPRLIRTPQEVTADLHIHTGASGDAFISDRRRFRSLLAGDVEVGVLTDHNQVRDPQSAMALLGLSGRLVLVQGVEFRIGPSGASIGHGNAFPISADADLPIPGSQTPAEIVANWRAHAEQYPAKGAESGALIQLNHPRGIQFWPDRAHQPGAHALFSELGMEPGVPLGEHLDDRLYLPDPDRGERIVDVDALEILNRFSVEGWLSVRADWFSLMNQGWFPTGTGNSDSHSAELERPGLPVNLVRVPVPERVGPEALVRAVKAGRVGVSTGPIVRMKVSSPGGASVLPGGMLTGPVSEAWVEVEVLAAPWVPVPEVRLVVDGEVRERVLLDEGGAEGGPLQRGVWWFKVPIQGDTWVLAEAGWGLASPDRPVDSLYARVAPGHVPIGFTNPVRVDADGDGRWTARVNPGLPPNVTSGRVPGSESAREE